MAKIVYICSRDRATERFSDRDMGILSEMIIPDNIKPNPPKIIRDNGILIGVFNPNEDLPVKSTSVCQGAFIGEPGEWWSPMSHIPDGAYALYRGDANTVEILSDMIASRTVWYVQTHDLFIASSSQRAIVFFLKSFKFDRSVIPWMLAPGNLGPGLSWDSRIKCLQGDSRLILNRETWELTIRTERVEFAPYQMSEEEHEEELKKVLADTFNHIDLDYSKWVFTLSGGFDTRCMLLMAKKKKGIRFITWGTKEALDDPENDAYIAKRLAEYFNVRHTYYEIKLPEEPVEKVIERFLVAGEGRVDHIGAYLDGFKIWKSLFEEGICGVVRGEQVFGLAGYSGESHAGSIMWNAFGVRRSALTNMVTDYFNLKDPEYYGFEKQVWPEHLKKRRGESLAAWCDRLEQEMRGPNVWGALNELRSGYVEIASPLISRKIVERVRKLPDQLRADKALFKKIVLSMSPSIPMAEHSAIPDMSKELKNKEFVNIIINELNTRYAKDLLSERFIKHILKHIKVCSKQSEDTHISFAGSIKRMLPFRIKNIMRNFIRKQTMDFNVLAFRAYMICKMTKKMQDDAVMLTRKQDI